MDNVARILALIAQGSGGSRGTTDYNDLENKPSVGGTTLSGEMTLGDLGYVVDDQLDSESTNPVQNGVIVNALATKLPTSTKYGSSLVLSIDNTTYVMTATLKDQDGNTLGTAQTIDLPLEAMVVSGSYDDNTKKIILTLKNGQTVEFSVADLISGLQTEITVNNKLSADLVDDSNTTNKFVTTAEKSKIAEIDDKYPKAWDIELTQAQYDALPPSKYNDGKNYYIPDGTAEEPIIYGIHIDPDESNPEDAVTYLADAIGMTPAAMGATTFNYGSWQNAFFMPKPCMLKYDGTVDYYLDPTDYSKKADGTDSDIADKTYAGNAMMEFPLIWFKFVAGTADGEGYFYVSNKRVDDSYKCWCNMDSDGNIIEHFYMAIYNGTMPDGLSDKMRSLSGLRLTPTIDGFVAYDNTRTYTVGALCKVDSTAYQCITAVTTAEEFDAEKWQEITPNNAGFTTGQQEVNAAVANDTTTKSEWYIETWCDRVLITALLYLMGKSLNLQATFGRGIDSGSQTAAEAYVTGAANDKGLFYGSTSNGNTVVKVFGIENFWACKWHRTAGLVGNSSGGYSYKMTASTADGSSVSGYNSNGNGYLTTTFNRPASNYVRLMEFGAHGALPLNTVNGSSATYYCNYFYTGTGYALVGGSSNSGVGCGFYVSLNIAFGHRGWDLAAALSCKPLAQKG